MTLDGLHSHNYDQFDLYAPSHFLDILNFTSIANYFLGSQICCHYISRSTEPSCFLRNCHSYLSFNLTRHLYVNFIHFWLFSWRNLRMSQMRDLMNVHSCLIYLVFQDIWYFISPPTSKSHCFSYD